METKKKYSLPGIEIILLDNEISLALQSTPPEGPDEGALLMPDVSGNQKCDVYFT